MTSNPTVLRPLPGASPMPVGAYDLAALGYVEEEFAFSGDAASYRLAGERTPDGRWMAEAGNSRLYTTRLLVRRPADGTQFSGTVVVEWMNVSGGLLSKGHPLGATGIANIFEVSTHLRGEAGDRQVEGARVGMTHVIGLASACSIHILERAAA